MNKKDFLPLLHLFKYKNKSVLLSSIRNSKTTHTNKRNLKLISLLKYFTHTNDKTRNEHGKY